MKKLATLISLVPSIALAHPGHDDVGIGGEPATHAVITNPVIVLALCMAVAFAFNLIVKKVRK